MLINHHNIEFLLFVGNWWSWRRMEPTQCQEVNWYEWKGVTSLNTRGLSLLPCGVWFEERVCSRYRWWITIQEQFWPECYKGYASFACRRYASSPPTWLYRHSKRSCHEFFSGLGAFRLDQTAWLVFFFLSFLLNYVVCIKKLEHFFFRVRVSLLKLSWYNQGYMKNVGLHVYKCYVGPLGFWLCWSFRLLAIFVDFFQLACFLFIFQEKCSSFVK